MSNEERETLSVVRGHLEGYADALEQNYATNDREVLVIALRDDARRLRSLPPEPKDTAPEETCWWCHGTGEDIEARPLGDLPLPPCPECQPKGATMMCECKRPVHSWEPGEFCPPERVIPAEDTAPAQRFVVYRTHLCGCSDPWHAQPPSTQPDQIRDEGR